MGTGKPDWMKDKEQQRPDRVIGLADGVTPDALVELEFRVEAVTGEYVEMSWAPPDGATVLKFRMTGGSSGKDIDVFVQGASRMLEDGMDAMAEMLEERDSRG